jgi:hypothetical protein
LSWEIALRKAAQRHRTPDERLAKNKGHLSAAAPGYLCARLWWQSARQYLRSLDVKKLPRLHNDGWQKLEWQGRLQEHPIDSHSEVDNVGLVRHWHLRPRSLAVDSIAGDLCWNLRLSKDTLDNAAVLRWI